MSNNERTFIMIKPDGVQRNLIGHIIARFEQKGFKLVAMKMLKPTRELLVKHYEEHKNKPFFESLISYIGSGPVVAMIWEGNSVITTARKMMGKTNPLDAEPGTIRGDFAIETERLLTLPYNSIDNVSMLIHRIGNTFLIDDLNLPSDISTMMRRLVLSEEDKSNFGNYSLPEIDTLKIADQQLAIAKSTFDQSSLVPGCKNDNAEYSNCVQKRPITWDFNSMKFLIGSSLPIFSNPEHPTVNVHMKDVREPITVLTALDCWLDNLICSVPELAICSHLDGIIQRYDLIRTDDIPKIKGAEFSPGQVKTVATRLLNFLKENATKQGHTYWLYKCPDSDKVRIYDLTSEWFNGNNPISKSLVDLMRRVASELIHSDEGRKKYPQTIKSLVSTCLTMINKDTDPESFCEMNFIMSHVLINDKENRLEGNPDIGNNSTDNLARTLTQKSCVSQITMKSLLMEAASSGCREEKLSSCGNIHDRASSAIKHITQALNTNVSTNHMRITKRKTLKHQRKDDWGIIYSLWYHTTEGFQRSEPLSADARALLILKAASAYYFLADAKLNLDKSFIGLHCLQICLNCFQVGWSALDNMGIIASQNLYDSKSEMLSRILALCGDCHMSIFMKMSKENFTIEDAFNDLLDYDQSSDKCITEVVDKCKMSSQIDKSYHWASKYPSTTVEAIATATKCFEVAVKCMNVDDDVLEKKSLWAKIACTLNENALYILHNFNDDLSADEADEYHKQCSDVEELLNKSLKLFIELDDRMGQVSAYCNMARLYRTLTKIYGLTDHVKEDSSFNQALECYNKALNITKRSSNISSNINEAILFDTCAALYYRASMYFEKSINKIDVDERRVLFLNKAVKKLMTNPFKDPTYRSTAFRWYGELNHRLAQHYNKHIRLVESDINEVNCRRTLQLIEVYYKRALDAYFEADPSSDNLCQAVRISLERLDIFRIYHSKPTIKLYCFEVLILIEACPSGIYRESINRELIESWYREITSSLKNLMKMLLLRKNSCSDKQIFNVKSVYKRLLEHGRNPLSKTSDLYQSLLNVANINYC